MFKFNTNSNFLLFSIFFNFLSGGIITILVYFCMGLTQQLKDITTNLSSFNLSIEEKFSFLNTQLIALKSENTFLKEKLNLSSLDIKALDVPSEIIIAPNISHMTYEYLGFMTKLIGIIILFLVISFLIYNLHLYTYWFYNGIIAKLFTIIHSLNLKLFGLFGIEQIKTITYRDIIGNDFLIRLSKNEETVEIFIKTIDMIDFISITQYISTLGSDLTKLTPLLHSLTASAGLLSAGLSSQDAIVESAVSMGGLDVVNILNTLPPII